MSIPISQFIPPPPAHPHFPLLVSIRLFSTSVSLFLPCKPVHLYHFSRFHIYALIYDICFSLSDLLHSVWQSLGPSTSQFHSFLWLSNIPLYVCITSSSSIRLSMDSAAYFNFYIVKAYSQSFLILYFLYTLILFFFFLWPSDIPLYIYTTSSLSIHLLMDT